MSSSSVCQGLESCLDPRAIEPRVLILKLAPPGSNFSEPSEWPSWAALSAQEISNNMTLPPAKTNDESDMKEDNNSDKGGWSFLQSLANISHCKKTEEPETEKVYVHPSVKRSSSKLSAKSLEMCTESLGSETGSNGSESSEDIALFSLENSTSFKQRTQETKRTSVSKRSKRDVSFPPPLSSVTTLGGLQVWPHREDGRLILEAVVAPPSPAYFQAERSNGRLTLRMFSSFNSYYDEVADDEGVGEEESIEEEDDAESEIADETVNQNVCGDEDAEAEKLDENGEDETGMRKPPRPSRCNEGGDRNNKLLNWEAYWVAT